MAKFSKIEPANPNWDSETNLLAWLATCVSVFAFLFYYRNGDVLLYGDAIAHINIARRVFDSKTPGLLQLGTVWLPLPHLLMVPFLLFQRMWQSGTGGSLPSMAAYVFSVIGIFRLTRGVLSRSAAPDSAARVTAWVATILFAANPNLIYMQATAMGEALYLAFFIWTVVYFAEFERGDAKALTRCGLCLAAACLTRYDGWFLAVAMAGVVLIQTFIGPALQLIRPTKAQAFKFILIAAAAPALWLAYNAIVYRNPLEFANGPYSAKAIERRTQNSGNPGHPGSSDPVLAEMYFLKSAEANVAQNEWLHRGWILLALASLMAGIELVRRKFLVFPAIAPVLLLAIPLPFYALSVAYSGVPIFIPYWWPFTHYNVRYGLQLLPALAVAPSLLCYAFLRADGIRGRIRLVCLIAIAAVPVASYISVWRTAPICLEEARVNMRTRNQFQIQLAILLEKLPPDSTLLMYLGDQVGALERAGIPLQHTINEGNHRVWRQPADVDGLWERALANPSQYADYVLAFEGDPVWQAVQGLHLHELVEIHVTGQARAVLYRAR